VILAACSRVQSCRDAEEAEAKATLRGLEMMDDQRHDKIVLELDCASVANAIHSTERNRSRLWFTVEETKRMLGNHSDFRIKKIRRDSNRAVDDLAKICSYTGNRFWFHSVPREIENIVTQDSVTCVTTII
jgi:ribonuclease HI